eukprot:12070749-Ditylum_brightwellii.AAC.1
MPQSGHFTHLLPGSGTGRHHSLPSKRTRPSARNISTHMHCNLHAKQLWGGWHHSNGHHRAINGIGEG